MYKVVIPNLFHGKQKYSRGDVLDISAADAAVLGDAVEQIEKPKAKPKAKRAPKKKATNED